MNDFFDAAITRLTREGLTLATAAQLHDDDLLRRDYIGRKTLRVIRTYQGPFLPLPTIILDMEEDGYIDYEDEEYNERYNAWQIGSDIPNLRENWCPLESDPIMTFEDIDFLHIALEA